MTIVIGGEMGKKNRKALTEKLIKILAGVECKEVYELVVDYIYSTLMTGKSTCSHHDEA